MDALGYLVIVVFCLVLATSWIRSRRRTAAIRALAARIGFHYLGTSLQASLTLKGTPLELVSRTWNVIDGERNGCRVVAFDFRIGVGKGSWKRTAIAAQSERDVFDQVLFKGSLSTDRSGEWIILHQPREDGLPYTDLMPIAVLEGYLDAVGRGPSTPAAA